MSNPASGTDAAEFRLLCGSYGPILTQLAAAQNHAEPLEKIGRRKDLKGPDGKPAKVVRYSDAMNYCRDHLNAYNLCLSFFSVDIAQNDTLTPQVQAAPVPAQYTASATGILYTDDGKNAVIVRYSIPFAVDKPHRAKTEANAAMSVLYGQIPRALLYIPGAEDEDHGDTGDAGTGADIPAAAPPPRRTGITSTAAPPESTRSHVDKTTDQYKEQLANDGDDLPAAAPPPPMTAAPEPDSAPSPGAEVEEEVNAIPDAKELEQAVKAFDRHAAYFGIRSGDERDTLAMYGARSRTRDGKKWSIKDDPPTRAAGVAELKIMKKTRAGEWKLRLLGVNKNLARDIGGWKKNPNADPDKIWKQIAAWADRLRAAAMSDN